MMALVIFSMVVLSLVGLSFRIAKHSTRSTDQALGMAVLLSKVDRAATTDFTALPGQAGCDTTVSGSAKVIGCMQVTAVSQRIDSILIIVNTTLPGARPDTIAMTRGRERRGIPLR
jgi:Tfp pilus assembly protein PilV